MNENLNLVKILKDCPKGTELYSPWVGEVYFNRVDYDSNDYPIDISCDISCNSIELSFTKDGRACKDGECLLFPSKDQHDWSMFKCPNKKFDPKTLQPFDKVVVKDLGEEQVWQAAFFSHIGKDTLPFVCTGSLIWRKCIPYNDETKHLVGTSDEAPEYYRYWEE